LALRTRQFYREHAKAIRTLSRILWNHRSSEIDGEKTNSLAETISIASEVRRSHHNAAQSRVDLRMILESVVGDAQILGSQRQTRVDCLDCVQTIILDVDRTLLRQTVLWLASQLIAQSTPGSCLHLKSEVVAGYSHVKFLVDDLTLDTAALHTSLSQQPTLAMFVQTLEANLIYESAGSGFRVTLAIPVNRTTILVIDDNPDLVELFRRYLADRPCSLLAADQGKQAIQLARTTRPDLIVLDIMMPGQDGLEILQNLKTHANTKGIPVMICSVLDAREMALSLGADAYLIKPPSQMDFLRALTQWQV
jgi:CheY-like chemotaxis protein